MKCMIKLLSTKSKDIREREIGAGRHFKLDVKDTFLMLLVYCNRLYITYTLAGFFFDLDQSNICRYSKDWKFDNRLCTYPTKDVQCSKEESNARGSWTIFSRLYGFHRFQQNNKFQDLLIIKERRYIILLERKKRNTL